MSIGSQPVFSVKASEYSCCYKKYFTSEKFYRIHMAVHLSVPFSSVGSAADRLSLASKRCVYDRRSKLKLYLYGSPAQERGWPVLTHWP